MDDTGAAERLPLGEAVLKWGDPELLAAAHKADALMIDLGPAPTRREIGLAEDHVIATRQALFEDFRRQVEYGAVQLHGVQTAPTRQASPTLIPGGWAADMEIDFAAGSVVCAKYRWIAVTASSAPVAAAQQQPEVVQARDGSGAEPDAGDEGQAPPAQRRGGRPKAEPLIRAAIERHWDYVTSLARPAGDASPVWKQIASRLHQRWVTDAKAGIGGPPVAEETVRKHLQRMYEALEGEKAGSQASAQ